MKVLLVQPPIEDFYDTSIRTYPLGLLYVGTRVGRVADVAILDARTKGKRQTIGNPFPELSPYYRDGTYTPFSLFARYMRFGLSYEEIRNAIEQEQPEVVGIGGMCSAYEKTAIETARAAKAVSPEIVTVIGGTHPTMFPEPVLAHECVDYCVRGEGETPFLKLVESLQSGDTSGMEQVPGLCFRRGDHLHLSPPSTEEDIDLIPDRHLIDPKRYRIGRKRYAFLLTSRGCPFSCGFCGKPPGRYRRRSLGQIEAEIEDCARLGIEAIDFEDDMLNLDTRFFASILDAFSGSGFTLSAMNGIYPNTLDITMLDHMFRAGFRRLNFSLVDVAGYVLAGQNRKDQQSFLELLPYLEGSPFLTEVHFIIGLPGQDPVRLLDTLIFLMEKRLLLGPSMFYMSPGSALHQNGGNDIPLDAMRSSYMLPFNPLFPRPVTFTLVKLVRLINYIKQACDRAGGRIRLSELPQISRMAGNERDADIIERLFRGEGFFCYDLQKQEMRHECVDEPLVRTFFQKAKGRTIKGYKSDNGVLVDI